METPEYTVFDSKGEAVLITTIMGEAKAFCDGNSLSCVKDQNGNIIYGNPPAQITAHPWPRFSVFDRDKQFVTSTTDMHHARLVMTRCNGWIEDEKGAVIDGKKPLGTIDMTPTWSAILPALLLIYTDGTDTAKAVALDSFKRMALIADNAVSAARKDD